MRVTMETFANLLDRWTQQEAAHPIYPFPGSPQTAHSTNSKLKLNIMCKAFNC